MVNGIYALLINLMEEVHTKELTKSDKVAKPITLFSFLNYIHTNAHAVVMTVY